MLVKNIGVYPSGLLLQNQRLFSSLKKIFSISFQEIDFSKDLDAFLITETNEEMIGKCTEKSIPIFLIDQRIKKEHNSAINIEFMQSDYLEFVLRNKTLVEKYSKFNSILELKNGDEILAVNNGEPIWLKRKVRESVVDIVTCNLEEIDQKEAIWSLVQYGRFISLLPLIHWLRKITKDINWELPPLRASFIVDDPNLHFAKYGNLDYKKLAISAKKNNYHVSIGIVPIDANFASKKAVKIFKENKRYLSLMIHGVKHLSHELSLNRTLNQALEYFSFGLKKIKKFEKKYGLKVSNTVIAPYGRISKIMLSALFLLGIEAFFVSGKPYAWTTEIPAEDLTAGWYPATLFEEGLPIILRNPLYYDETFTKSRNRQELILAAFLKRPLIAFGHNEDFIGGFELFEENAEFINSLGDVEWLSTDQIAKTNYLQKHIGNDLHVKLLSRISTIDISPDIKNIIVEKFDNNFRVDYEYLLFKGKQHKLLSGKKLTIDISSESGSSVEIELVHPDLKSPDNYNSEKSDLNSYTRRFLCEVRDRVINRY